jgi:hypothetical protein
LLVKPPRERRSIGATWISNSQRSIHGDQFIAISS